MKKQKGITLVSLTITIIVMIIIASITLYTGRDLLKKARLQDLVTSMLLIQAKTKEYVEEVNFQTANLDPTKEEDLAKINEIKSENLKGVLLQGSEAETDARATGKITENIDEYYYLSEETLQEMGIKDLGSDYGYFIVRYDITNTKVEVINTNGFNEKYSLDELKEMAEE